MAEVARKQQRLWSEDEAKPDAETRDETKQRNEPKPAWSLDSKTKQVGRAGLAAARKRIRRTRKAG